MSHQQTIQTVRDTYNMIMTKIQAVGGASPAKIEELKQALREKLRQAGVPQNQWPNELK